MISDHIDLRVSLDYSRGYCKEMPRFTGFLKNPVRVSVLVNVDL